MPRMFFGVDVPAKLQQALRELRDELVTAGVKADAWSNPALYHLTLVFLGSCDIETMPVLKTAGLGAAEQVNPFELTLRDLGMFERSGVLWTGIAEDAGATALHHLQAHLSRAITATQAFKLESRAFRPHLTLARSVPKHQAALIKRLRTLPQQQLHSRSFEVSHLSLFESTRQEGQLAYPIVEQFPLGQPSLHL